MPIAAVYANLSCKALPDAARWFAAVFGREADRRPMEGLLEWDCGDGGLQLFQKPEDAGRGTLTLIVEDIRAERDRPRASACAQRRLGPRRRIDVGVDRIGRVQPFRQGARQVEAGPSRLGRRQHPAVIVRRRVRDHRPETGHAQRRDLAIGHGGDQLLRRLLGPAGGKAPLVQRDARRIGDAPDDLGPARLDREEDRLAHGRSDDVGFH